MSEQARHTPGPWEIDDDNIMVGPLIDNAYWYVALIDPCAVMELAEAEANARLIAAAPELLELVKELRHKLSSDTSYPDDVPMINRLDAAIEKAEGRAA